jgi:DNA end-binding protein Ku
MVSIPIKLYAATEEKTIGFKQVRRSDGAKIKYKRVAETDGQEVPYSEIAKGYELSKDEIIVLEDSDFENLPLTTSRIIDIVGFVSMVDIDPTSFVKSYFLEPTKEGRKPYVLLRTALEQSDKVGVVKITLRQREHLAVLLVRGDVLMLETVLWPSEIRKPAFDFMEDSAEVSPQELAMAHALIEAFSINFDPSLYTDGYQEALEAVIEAKIAGRVLPAKPNQTAVVADLMATLMKSIEAKTTIV